MSLLLPFLHHKTAESVHLVMMPSFAQMATISHLKRLRTLIVEAEPFIGPSKFRVLSTPEPPPQRLFSVSAAAGETGRDIRISCPALAPGAVVQLSTEDQRAPHVGVEDLMEHLLCWIKSTGAACVVLQPYCDLEEEAEEDDDEVFDDDWERSFRLEVDSGGEREYMLGPGPDGTSEFERELWPRCSRHGFHFAQSPDDQSVHLTRLA